MTNKVKPMALPKVPSLPKVPNAGGTPAKPSENRLEVKLEDLRKERIFIATPCYGGQLTEAYFRSTIRLLTFCNQHQIPIAFGTIANESLVTRARNVLVAYFLQSDFTRLMFIDADIEFQVEDVIKSGAGLTGPLKFAKVLSIEEITEFKKPIRYVGLDCGEKEVRYVICGATNFAVGDVVVAALPGAVLPGDFKIAARETYGKTSNGMICSSRELGLGEDHSGIMVFAEGDVRVLRVERAGVADGALDLLGAEGVDLAFVRRHHAVVSLRCQAFDRITVVPDPFDKIHIADSRVLQRQIDRHVLSRAVVGFRVDCCGVA
jgi:tRNA-binding EMAP/Myf-like protein